MKKKIIAMIVVTLLGVSMLAGCTSNPIAEQESTVMKAEDESIEVVIEETEEEKAEEQSGEKVNEVTGTLEEVKDFMFVVTDEAGTSYGFSVEEVPEGLEEVKIGDKVLVKFTGIISQVDPFKGEVLSVEKQ